MSLAALLEVHRSLPDLEVLALLREEVAALLGWRHRFWFEDEKGFTQGKLTHLPETMNLIHLPFPKGQPWCGHRMSPWQGWQRMLCPPRALLQPLPPPQDSDPTRGTTSLSWVPRPSLRATWTLVAVAAGWSPTLPAASAWPCRGPCPQPLLICSLWGLEPKQKLRSALSLGWGPA